MELIKSNPKPIKPIDFNSYWEIKELQSVVLKQSDEIIQLRKQDKQISLHLVYSQNSLPIIVHDLESIVIEQCREIYRLKNQLRLNIL